MGKHSHTLKILRAIALEHGAVAQPDLASLARELGRAVHQNMAIFIARADALSTQRRRFRCWSLAERRMPPLRVILTAWPANHVTTMDDHTGQWGLEMTLVGAIEVQSYSRCETGTLRAGRRDWLGPGDSSWFEQNDDQLQRSRNLSSRGIALTLRVVGGDLSRQVACAQARSAGSQAAPGRSRPTIQPR